MHLMRALPESTMRALIGLFLLASGPSAFAQSGELRVDWASIDAGGGSSTGGIYSVSGTIAQVDADPLQPASGGNFELTGGFWAGIAPQSSQPDAIFNNGFETP
jgi:hypothetical protein